MPCWERLSPNLDKYSCIMKGEPLVTLLYLNSILIFITLGIHLIANKEVKDEN